MHRKIQVKYETDQIDVSLGNANSEVVTHCFTYKHSDLIYRGYLGMSSDNYVDQYNALNDIDITKIAVTNTYQAYYKD